MKPESANFSIDPELKKAIELEEKRQVEHLELIASENYVSPAVRTAVGSVLTNKYAEGYPGKRYYGGCEFVDIAESLAIDRAKKLFSAEAANVQPHCGSSANMAAFLTFLNPGDSFLGMDLAHGGHLTHGSKVNFSGKLFHAFSYGLNPETERIDFDDVEKKIKEHKPKMLIAGASAYSRIIDFEKFGKLSKEYNVPLLVDMAHIAGLVAAGAHPSPIPHAEIVTTTTHKTLRGPRSGLILMKTQHEKKINSWIFPGIQGGPLMHVIAGKAAALHEASTGQFKNYVNQVLTNAKKLAEALSSYGYKIVSGGTDNHIVLVDLSPKGITGKDAEATLGKCSITVNKNAVPFDKLPPNVSSGIRLGTPALTTRGMGTKEMGIIAELIDKALMHSGQESILQDIKGKVHKLTSEFGVP